MKKAVMSEEIVSANYQQIPVDLKGCLYTALKPMRCFLWGRNAAGYSIIPIQRTQGKIISVPSAIRIMMATPILQIFLYTQDGMEITEPAYSRHAGTGKGK